MEATTSRKRPRTKAPQAREAPRATRKLPLSNAQIAELLALEGEKAEGHKRRALFRAAHEAFIWNEEVAILHRDGVELTTLPTVGPSIARRISGWLNDPPKVESPPEIRRQFLTMAEARQVLRDHPEWRSLCQGDLQMHTTWSDGGGSVRDMAQEGLARGYSYICVTEHTKGLKIARGMDEEQLARQGAEIAAVNKEFQGKSQQFRVLQGVEMNISPDGAGDMESDALGQLDLVLGSFHSALRVKGDQTARYLAAIANRDVQVLGHPRGRVYNYRLGLEADWRRVFAGAAGVGKAVEIDGYSDRQDLQLDLLQIAREEGVRISLGSDAHSPEQLQFLDLSLALAWLARIPADRIINFMSATELAEWVGSVRERQD